MLHLSIVDGGATRPLQAQFQIVLDVCTALGLQMAQSRYYALLIVPGPLRQIS